ncbi:MAG TPA: four helix bundle protein [Edaphocola sp.]|nr:four helix bundle protein [Edaphocola sp.]
MGYNEMFRDKTKRLALAIIKTFSSLPYSDTIAIIRKQIIRSSTSVAANYRALNRARSDKERFAKLCIVIEEADETLFWLELAEELNLISTGQLKQLIQDAEEIVKATASYRKKLSQ